MAKMAEKSVYILNLLVFSNFYFFKTIFPNRKIKFSKQILKI